MSIIEGLVAAIIALSLYLGYQAFFGKGFSSDAEMGGIDSVKLEQTLEKILQSQGAGRSSGSESSANIPGSVYNSTEVDQIVASLAESDRNIEELKAELAAAKASVSAASSSGGSGMSGQEKTTMENKIRDLETRLGEYDIISEDIADLARFKEENERLRIENENLRAELEALKAKGPVAAAPASPAAAPAPVASAPAEPEPEPLLVEEPSLIDDDLMAEFAAAVENQKTSTGIAAQAGDATTIVGGTPDETSSLMNEFEEFAKKS